MRWYSRYCVLVFLFTRLVSRYLIAAALTASNSAPLFTLPSNISFQYYYFYFLYSAAVPFFYSCVHFCVWDNAVYVLSFCCCLSPMNGSYGFSMLNNKT